MKLKSTLAAVITAATCLTLFASEAPKKATAQNKKAFNDRVEQLGGFVIYPNSQKGRVAFIDTQSDIDFTKEFDEVFKDVKRQIPIKLDFLKMSAGEPLKLKSVAKADFAVIIVYDESLPTSMIVPEEKYAVVNVAKYKKGLKMPSEAALCKKRCSKAALKAYMLLCGGCASRYPGHVGTAQSVNDLDISHDKLPIDIQESMKKYLASAGVTPLRKTIYRKACQEGWAPAPTNEYQKAIWDKVRSEKERGPTNPIEIPMPKKK